jgi:hypothetical protein
VAGWLNCSRVVVLLCSCSAACSLYTFAVCALELPEGLSHSKLFACAAFLMAAAWTELASILQHAVTLFLCSNLLLAAA